MNVRYRLQILICYRSRCYPDISENRYIVDVFNAYTHRKRENTAQKGGVKAVERRGTGVEKVYIGATLTPISLAGLFLGGKAIVQTVAPSVVSAIVPVYNGEQTLEACIEALQAQTNKPAEVFVVDDSSTDGTSALLKSLSQKYSNLTVVRNGENKGKAASIMAKEGEGETRRITALALSNMSP